MSEPVDRELLAERTASVLAHLDRVADHLPDDPGGLAPMSVPIDTVVLGAAARPGRGASCKAWRP